MTTEDVSVYCTGCAMLTEHAALPDTILGRTEVIDCMGHCHQVQVGFEACACTVCGHVMPRYPDAWKTVRVATAEYLRADLFKRVAEMQVVSDRHYQRVLRNVVFGMVAASMLVVPTARYLAGDLWPLLLLVPQAVAIAIAFTSCTAAFQTRVLTEWTRIQTKKIAPAGPESQPAGV